MLPTQLEILAPIQKLKNNSFGVYQDLITNVSTSNWDGNLGLMSPRVKWRKTWLFVGTVNENCCAGFAIVDAGYMATAFVYHYNLKTQELVEDSIKVPKGFAKDFDPSLYHTWKLKNYKIESTGSLIKCSYKGKKFSLNIECQNTNNGLSFLCPSEGKRPFHFTYKNLALDAKVELKQQQQTETYVAKGGLDFSKGYPPRHTFWNWTSFMGKMNGEAIVGINLVDGFNQNMENAVWVNGEAQLLGKADYTYSKPLAKKEWNVVVKDRLELCLKPLGARKENTNVLLLKSKFTQVYGKMTGRLFYEGAWQDLEGHGVMEEHEALW